MSQIAREFIVDWLNENAVGADAIETEEDETPAEVLAARCRADAKADGISDQEFEDAIDDLTGGSGFDDYIAKFIETAIDEDPLPVEEKED